MPELHRKATWNPVRDLWETDQTVLLSEHSAAYSEILPPSGMTRNGVLFERPTSGPRTSGPGCSSSRTESALLSAPGAAEAEGVSLLPTPVAQPSGNTPEEHLRKKPGRVRVTDLAILVENGLLPSGGRMLPTPRTSDTNGPGAHGTGGLDLRTAVTLLPTPQAGRPGGKGQDPEKRRGANHQVWLADVIEFGCFGDYAPAIRRWEQITGHPAPPPTEPTGRNGAHRLSAKFAEWMMGLLPGWVTGIPISRTEQLRAIGNGVVPQQAVAALVDMKQHFEPRPVRDSFTSKEDAS